MYYQEKKAIAVIFAMLLIIAAYGVYVISKYREIGADLLYDLKFWAAAMLIAIGGGIVLIIIILIIFHIILSVANEVAKEAAGKAGCGAGDESFGEVEILDFEDEMDKLIALKAVRNSFAVVGAGFIASLVSLYMEMPPGIMLNVIFISFNFGSLVEGFSQLYFYRKGIQNG